MSRIRTAYDVQGAQPQKGEAAAWAVCSYGSCPSEGSDMLRRTRMDRDGRIRSTGDELQSILKAGSDREAFLRQQAIACIYRGSHVFTYTGRSKNQGAAVSVYAHPLRPSLFVCVVVSGRRVRLFFWCFASRRAHCSFLLHRRHRLQHGSKQEDTDDEIID